MHRLLQVCRVVIFGAVMVMPALSEAAELWVGKGGPGAGRSFGGGNRGVVGWRGEVTVLPWHRASFVK